jgi:hypothetical protein
MLLSSSGFSSHFAALFALDTSASSHARAAATAQNLPQFDAHLAELRETLTPEVELVESRVLAPAREYVAIAKALRKNVTKRDHKVSAGSVRAGRSGQRRRGVQASAAVGQSRVQRSRSMPLPRIL